MTKRPIETHGPLAAYVVSFTEMLRDLGYERGRTASHLGLLADLSDWLVREALAPAELTTLQIARFIESRRARGVRDLVTPRGVALLVEHLRDLGAAPPASRPAQAGAAGAVLTHFADYLECERGLAVRGVQRYLTEIGPFIAEVSDENGIDWTKVSAASVTRFMVKTVGSGRAPTSNLLAALRGFLRFAYLEGSIDAPLAQAVPSVASWNDQALPRRLSPDEIRQVLAHCDRRSPAGWRDFAILLLLVRLGLRANEVSSLSLGDMDWHKGEIVVRGKGSREERMPLPVDVGQAIADYLQQGRPQTPSRAVFLRLSVPLRGLGPIGVTALVYRACTRAGVARVSAHMLRHTAATEMLRAGASLSEVGQTLRQRSPRATALYAKVDHASLRTLAPEWPENAQ